MAVEGVPWLTTGASHSADIGRMLAYTATNGATGIAVPTDFKVTAQGTPNNTVAVAPGGATLVNKYPAGAGQSYIIRNQSSTNVTVSAAPAGPTLVRYLIAYVEDPQYGGASPVAYGGTVLAGPYVKFQLVSTITNILYPFIALAMISQPPSTSTVLQSYITDLRELVNPRTNRVVLCNVPTTYTLNETGFIDFPKYSPTCVIPPWATWVIATSNLQGLFMQTGPTYGGIRMELRNSGGTLDGATGMYDINIGSSGGNGARTNGLGAVIGVTIPSAMRGLTTTIASQMHRNVAATDPGRILTDAYTQVTYDLFFTESVQ